MRTIPAIRPAFRRFGAVSTALLLSLLSCGREITGPADGIRIATGLSFVAEFPRPLADVAEGSGDIVPFTRVRIFFLRSDNSIAFDRSFPFGATTDSLPLAISIPLSPDASVEGEPLSLFLRYTNASGDTVFSGGPVQVLAVPRQRGDPLPSPAQVPLSYTGPGAEATTVELTPDTLTVVAGDPFVFTATARDGQGAAVSAAPIIFSALDANKAPVASLTSGSGTTLATRGLARVQAMLVANGAADTAFVQITPKPASLQRLGLTALAGPANSVLADSVVLRLLATDGGPIADAAVTVTIEGGGGVNDTTLVTDANGRAAVQWTLGSIVGVAAQRLRFNATGVAELIVTANVTAPTLSATQLFISSQATGSRLSGEVIAPELVVQARNANNEVVTDFAGSVSVGIASGPAGASLAGVTTVNAVNGFATFTNFSADLVGAYQFVVTSAGLTPDTTTAITITAGAPATIELVSGNAQTASVGALLPSPITVRVRDGGTNPVPNVNVVFVVTSGGGTLQGASVLTDSLGLATLGSWTLGATAGTQSINATFGALSPVPITATAEPLVPVIELKVVASNVVGFQRAGELFVRLLQPAPVGGLTVTVTSDSAQYLIIDEPGTVAIAAGDTAATIGVFGSTIGTAVVRANAPGYTPDTLTVPVSLNLISLPTTLNVALDGTASLPVQLSTAAPAGGAVVRLTSSNPSAARAAIDSVVIAAGSTTANATVQGLTIGSTTITATNPNYAPDASTVSVTASIEITNTSLSLNQSFGTPMTVRLASGGFPVAAPAGGISVNLEAVNPACVSVPSSTVIGAGLTSVIVNVVAGPGPTFPCSSLIRATGPVGFATDSTNASVAVTPAINGSALTIGAGLQRGSSFSLGASNHGGVTVRVASLDSTRVLIAPDATTLGSPFLDFPINISFTSATFTVQTLEGVTQDTVSLVLSAPGFVSDTVNIVITEPLHSITNLTGTRTTAAIDDAFTVRIGSPSSPVGNIISSFDAIRFGGPDRVFSVVNDSITRGELVTTALVADSVTVIMPAGTSTTASSVASGGVAFRSQDAGVTTVRVLSAQSRPTSAAGTTVTTSLSSITSMTAMTGTNAIGRGLQRLGSIVISEAMPTGDSLPITVRASRPGFAVLSSDNALAGTADTVVTYVRSGQNSAILSVQILESAPLDTFSLIMSAPGYQGLTRGVEVILPLIRISTNLNLNAVVGAADDPFSLETGSPNGATGGSVGNFDLVRRGGPGLIVDIVNDSTQLGKLVDSVSVADSMRLVIPPGARLTPSLVSAGGIAFRYLAGGTAVLRASSPAARAQFEAVREVVIAQPAISGLTTFGIAAGHQRTGSIQLNTPAPVGGLVVRLRADTPNTVLFSLNASTVGSDSLDITVPAGNNSVGFLLQVLEVPDDTITITASAAGWTPRDAVVQIWRPVLDFSTFSTTATTLSPDASIIVRVGSPSSPIGTTISSTDSRRAGAAPLPVTLVSSNGFVGRLVNSTTVSDTLVVNILAGTTSSSNSIATGGVAFRPLTSGTTSISASAPGIRQSTEVIGTTVTVTTPAISIGSTANVGAGLQTTGSVTLGASLHGGVSVILKSSNPAILKVARFATDVATDSIIVPLADGLGNFAFLLAGMEDTTGVVTLTARAIGFTDGSSPATVVRPAVEIQSLTTPLVAGGADVQFRVRVGLPNGSQTAIATVQNVRAGSAGAIFNVTSSNTAVGTLVTTALTGSPVTVTVPAGTAASATLISGGGVGFRPLTPGTSTVTVSAPNFITMVNNGNVTVTVNP